MAAVSNDRLDLFLTMLFSAENLTRERPLKLSNFQLSCKCSADSFFVKLIRFTCDESEDR